MHGGAQNDGRGACRGWWAHCPGARGARRSQPWDVGRTDRPETSAVSACHRQACSKSAVRPGAAPGTRQDSLLGWPPQVGALVTGLWSPLVDTDRGSGTGSELEVSQHARGLRRLSGLLLSATCSRPGLFGLNTSAWLLRTYYVWRCVIWGVRRRGLPRGRCCTGHGSQSSVQWQRERPRGPRGG